MLGLNKFQKEMMNRMCPDLERFTTKRNLPKDHKTFPNDENLRIFHNGKSIGYINYNKHTGQIGLFFIDPKYQGCGIGTKYLHKIIDDIKDYGEAKEIWMFTSKGHYFWSKAKHDGKCFTYRDPAHPSISGDGYYMEI